MMIFNYMTIRGVPGTWQTTATGLLLLAAMVGGRLLQRNSGSDAATGEAFHDDLAGMSRIGAAVGARLDRRGDAAARDCLCRRSTRASLTVANFIGAGRAERSARHRLGRRDDRHRLARRRHLAGLGARARRRRRRPLPASHGVPVPLALLAGIATASAVYALNGLIVGGLGLDPLIVTLAAWIWARGLAISLTNATTIPFDMGFVTLMNTPLLLGFTPAVAADRAGLPRRLADPGAAADRHAHLCAGRRSRACCARRASTRSGCASRCWC